MQHRHSQEHDMGNPGGMAPRSLLPSLYGTSVMSRARNKRDSP